MNIFPDSLTSYIIIIVIMIRLIEKHILRKDIEMIVIRPIMIVLLILFVP